VRTDLAPPQQHLRGFVRWPAPGADSTAIMVTSGSWLELIPVAFFGIFGLLCFAFPFLAVMPGQPPLTNSQWFPLFSAWLFSALSFYAARLVLRLAQPYQLSLDLCSRRYALRKGFRPNVKVWTGDFDDIQKIYVWERRERSADGYIHNVIISWAMKGVETSLWTYISKKPDDPKPEAWATKFCQELGVPFGGVLTGKYTKTWRRD